MKDVIDVLVVCQYEYGVKDKREYIMKKIGVKDYIINVNPCEMLVLKTPNDSKFLGKGLRVKFRLNNTDCLKGLKPDVVVTSDPEAKMYFRMYTSEIYSRLEDIL